MFLNFFQISMLEIYNDTLKDLLAKSAEAALEIRVQGKSVSVPGLTKILVRTEADILLAMETGEGNRRVASTRMNTQRCRSSSSNSFYRQHFQKRNHVTSPPSTVPAHTCWWRWRWRARTR